MKTVHARAPGGYYHEVGASGVEVRAVIVLPGSYSTSARTPAASGLIVSEHMHLANDLGAQILGWSTAIQAMSYSLRLDPDEIQDPYRNSRDELFPVTVNNNPPRLFVVTRKVVAGT